MEAVDSAGNSGTDGEPDKAHFCDGNHGAEATIASDAGAVDALAAGETLSDTFTVKVADDNGDCSRQSVNITITGTNDAAVLSSATANLTETNAAADISTGGQLTISDVDSPATFVAQSNTAGTYGTFAIDTSGKWTYTAASAHNEFATGQVYTDT